MTIELVVYRGLPASGKTTLAKAYVAADPEHRARVNRDELREMLHGGYVNGDVERVVRIARDRLIKAFLDQGVSVACDDTNLPQKVARDLARLARYAGAHVRVSDLTDVDVELCVLRDLARAEKGLRSVGEAVIRGMYDRYLAGKTYPLPLPDDDEPAGVERYVAKPGTPRAIIVDLDGTLCLHNGRSPYDETRVGDDLPNRAVVEAVRAARASGLRVVFCSGRTEGCRVASERWIDEHVFDASHWGIYRDPHPYEVLLMRAEGDKRKDSIVKREIFDREIRDHYDVVYVLDDRQQVVDAWRELGLTVFQVAPGQF